MGEPLLPADERSPQAWFDRNAVVIPTNPSQPLGNAPRNSSAVRRSISSTSGLSKIFELSRQGRLELRLEASNVLNKTNFRAPEGNRSLASFGTITGTYDPRQIQLGVKLSF